LIDIRDYVYSIEGERATSIVSATGCPFACTYCSHWKGYRQLEAKSSDYVRREIRQVRDVYGFRSIMFYDDEINLRPDFTTEFLPMLKEEGITWRAFFKNGRNLTNDETFKAMAESGCVQLCTGAESANVKILKDIKKGATKDDNTAFVRLCVKNGIKPKVFTQVGLPGENRETIKELRDWLVAMANEGLNDADVSITTPYEGTPIYEEPEKHNIKFDKAKLDYANDVVLYKGVPGEYKSYVWNDDLSKDDIVNARQWVEDEFRSAAGLLPLLAKDDG
jgi:p-methyltransferase